MHIFVDEAGSFIPTDRKKWAISCVGALVVPDSAVGDLLRDFQKLKNSWGVGEHEVKGRELSENQVNQVAAVLGKYDLFFEVTCIDMAVQSHGFSK